MCAGPDGIGDFRVRVEEQQFIGHGSMSPEASSDTQYLYRAAQVRCECSDRSDGETVHQLRKL